VYIVGYNKLPRNVKRNNLIAISAISIAIVTTSIMISTGFGRSKVLMDIEAYEREEASEQAKVAKIPTVIKPTLSNEIPQNTVNIVPAPVQNPVQNNPNIDSGEQVTKKIALTPVPNSIQNNLDNIDPSNQENISSVQDLREQRIEEINNRERKKMECKMAVNRLMKYVEDHYGVETDEDYEKTLEDDVRIVCKK
jgi:hypothetical protein